jgi:hypothetical protein
MAYFNKRKRFNNENQSSPKNGIGWFYHFPKNFIPPYGPTKDELDEAKIIRRLFPSNCEYLKRPKIALSELAETVAENLNVLKSSEYNLVHRDHFNILSESLANIKTCLTPMNNKINDNPSEEEIKRAIRSIIEPNEQLENYLQGAYITGCNLATLSIQVLAARALFQNPEQYGIKVEASDGTHKQFKANPNFKTMKSFLVATCKSPFAKRSTAASMRTPKRSILELFDSSDEEQGHSSPPKKQRGLTTYPTSSDEEIPTTSYIRKERENMFQPAYEAERGKGIGKGKGCGKPALKRMQYSQSPDEEQYSSSLQNKLEKLTSRVSFNDEQLERRYYGSREHEGNFQSSYEIEEQKYIGKRKGKGISTDSLDEDQCYTRDRKRQKLLPIVYPSRDENSPKPSYQRNECQHFVEGSYEGEQPEYLEAEKVKGKTAIKQIHDSESSDEEEAEESSENKEKVLTTHPIRTDKHASTRSGKKKEGESIAESPCKDERNESTAKGKDRGKSKTKHFSEALNDTCSTAVISVKANSKENSQKKPKSTNMKVVEESNIENEKVKGKHKSKAKAETKIENETQNAVSASGTKESKRSKKSSNEVKDPAISVPPCQGENEKGKKNEKANRKNNMPFDKEMPAEKGTEKKVEIETAELVHKKSKKSKKNKK